MILTRNVGPEGAETLRGPGRTDFRDFRAKITANPTYDRVCGLLVFLETMKSANPSLRGVSGDVGPPKLPILATLGAETCMKTPAKCVLVQE